MVIARNLFRENLTPASRHQDHTTSPSDLLAFVWRKQTSGQMRITSVLCQNRKCRELQILLLIFAVRTSARRLQIG
jgi:hypothetical protein